jgi:hypothetical protein
LLADCRAVAAENGGQCLSLAYVNAKTPLRWRCGKGHVWLAIPNNVRHFSWCPTCYDERRGRKMVTRDTG